MPWGKEPKRHFRFRPVDSKTGKAVTACNEYVSTWNLTVSRHRVTCKNCLAYLEKQAELRISEEEYIPKPTPPAPRRSYSLS